jgi:hypothetical protein
MKATLTFDMSDPDDRAAHMRAIKSLDMAAALWELVHNTHNKIDNAIDVRPVSDPMTPDQVLEMYSNELHNILEAHSIDVDDLY